MRFFVLFVVLIIARFYSIVNPLMKNNKTQKSKSIRIPCSQSTNRLAFCVLAD